ncbi:MAG: hypothetical protein ACE5HT_16880 [Gemmatimonadales bacterium]
MHPEDLKRFFRDDLAKRFSRSGTTVQAWNSDYFIEIRRAAWLRPVGPIEERLIATEETPVANESIVKAVTTP